MELDLQVSPEKIMSREPPAGLRKLDFFRFEFFLNSSATDVVLVTLPSMAVETANCAVHKSLGNGEGTPP